MIRVPIDSDTYLEVDFEGLLSPRQEEVAAWRFAGKSNAATSELMGVSPDTTNKTQRKAYEKTHVDGTDNPLALLMCKAFQNGWAKFIAMGMVMLCLAPTARIHQRSVARISARRTETYYSAIVAG